MFFTLLPNWLQLNSNDERKDFSLLQGPTILANGSLSTCIDWIDGTNVSDIRKGHIRRMAELKLKPPCEGLIFESLSLDQGLLLNA